MCSGRWLSPDPIGINGGLNQYVFCDNNPVNSRDPNGKNAQLLMVVGALGVIYAVHKVVSYVYGQINKVNATPENDILGPSGARCMIDVSKDWIKFVAPDPTLGKLPDQGAVGDFVISPLLDRALDKAYLPLEPAAIRDIPEKGRAY